MPVETEAVVMNSQFDRLGVKQHKLVEKKPICDECALINNRILGIIKVKRKCALCKRKAYCSLTTPPQFQTHREREDSDDDPIFRCPDCGEEVTHLNYYIPCTENGTYRLSTNSGGGDYNDGDHDTSGDATFSCPECGNDIDRDEVENNHTTREEEDGEEDEEGGGDK